MQRVVAKIHFKEGMIGEFKKVMEDPVNGLNFTKKCDGFIDITSHMLRVVCFFA